MSDLNPKVAALVERALKKSPDLSSAELKERAVKVDKTVAGLSGRQFHARYALQARRKLFGGKRTTSAATKSRRRPAASPASSDPAVALLTASYREKTAELQDAIDAAFQRAIEADSVKRINELLESIEKGTRKFAEV